MNRDPEIEMIEPTYSNIEMPNFNVDRKDIPTVYVHKIKFENFKGYGNFEIDFTNVQGDIKKFICLCGNNGYGKTTILDAIQLIFINLNGYEERRKREFLKRNIRNKIDKTKYDDFKLTALMSENGNEYEYEITSKGIQKPHPENVRNYLARIPFYAKFDQELEKLTLPVSQWDKFKYMFQEVTGFEIERNEDFGLHESEANPILNDKILGFYVKKPNETILNKDCSAGEKKIIRTFSALLSYEYDPSIILIDNFEMHVELGRHLNLVKCIRSSFPNTQLITTTHSYRISRNIKPSNLLYDLRILRGPELIRKEPWRMKLYDKLQDSFEDISNAHIEDKEYIKETINLMKLILENTELEFETLKKMTSEIIYRNNSFYLNSVKK